MKTTVKLPNFLIIGVQKAGTTSIYNYLNQHPQVYMSSVKETNFLERDWQLVDPEIQDKYPKRICSEEKYFRLFENVGGEIAIGEASPNYLFHYDLSIPQILKYVPNAQLITVLRNPTDRAFSDYLMHVRDAVGKNHQPLAEQIKKRSQQSFVLRKGLYYEPLKHFIDTFGKEKISVFLYDDLCQDAVKFMQEIYTCIGVDSTFVPNTSHKAQVAQVPKNESINNILKTKNPLRNSVGFVLRYILPEETRQKIRNGLINLNSSGKDKISLSSTDKEACLNFYREDILKVQDLINRDLSAWLK